MAKGQNQKRKLLYLLDILERETDEEHPLTLEQLRQLLADPAAILAMAQHNADYYQTWLRPEQQVRQALRQLEAGEK